LKGSLRGQSGFGSSYGSSSDNSLHTVLGAARGPGDYHGTMRKSELEKDAGGKVFSSSKTSTT